MSRGAKATAGVATAGAVGAQASGLPQAPPAPPAFGVAVNGPGENDIEVAHQLSKEGIGSARNTLSVRQRRLWALLLIVPLVISVSFTAVGVKIAVDAATAQASRDRLNGIAQDQARGALWMAIPANQRLLAEGFAPVPIPGVFEAPAADVVNTAAAAQVLATVNPIDIATSNAAVIGPAVDRTFDAGIIEISQSGPTRIRTASIIYQYMQLRAVGAVPRMTAPPLPPEVLPPPQAPGG